MRRLFVRRKTFCIAAAISALVFLVGAIFIKVNQEDTRALESSDIRVSQTTGGQISGGGWYSNQFYIDGNRAWCAQARNNAPWGHMGNNQPAQKIKIEPSDAAADQRLILAYKIMYYGVLNGYSDMSIHLALTLAYAPNSIGWVELTQGAQGIYNLAYNQPLPEGERYLILVKNGNTNNYQTGSIQHIMTYTYKKVEKKEVTVEKVWNDDNNKSSFRPNAITVHLLNNGNEIDKVVLTKDNGWKHTFNELDINGDYTVTEDDVRNYIEKEPVCVADPNKANHTICTLENTLDITELKVVKEWVDEDNKNNLRPEKIDVFLLVDGYPSSPTRYVELNAGNNWQATFDNLEKDHEYSVVEERIENYEQVGEPDCHNGTCVITNTLEGYRTFSFTKVWNDHNDASGLRPKYVEIRVFGFVIEDDGYRRELPAGSMILRPDTDTEPENPNTWKRTIGPFNKYYQGKEIEYEVVEVFPDSYAAENYTSSLTIDENDNYVMTNSFNMYTSLSIEKTWWDEGDEGSRKTAIFDLYENGEPALDSNGNQISYSMTSANRVSYTPTASDLANLDKPEVQAKMNRWELRVDKLDKYDDNGLIEYTVKERPVEGYESFDLGCTKPTKAENETIVCRAENIRKGEIVVGAKKIWQDGGDASLIKRPENITIQMYRVEKSDTGSSAVPIRFTSFMLSEADNWIREEAITLPKYDRYGREMEYTATEFVGGQYESSMNLTKDEDSYLFEFTNTHTETTNIFVKKCWIDDNSTRRPKKLNFTFRTTYKGNTTESELVLTDENIIDNCYYTSINDLPLYDTDGNIYTYEIEEDDGALEDTDYVVEGSKVCDLNEQSGYDCVITNKLSGTVSVDGTKTWLDDSNKLGYRPSDIKLNLYRRLMNSEEEFALVEATPTWSNKNTNTWKYVFADLDKYNENGERYEYVVEEAASVIDVAKNISYVSKETAEKNNFVNVLTGTLDFCGKKVWRNNMTAPSAFQSSDITVTLRGTNGSPYIDATTVNSSTSEGFKYSCGDWFTDNIEVGKDGVTEIWYFGFTNVPGFNDKGEKYTYEFNEDAVETYLTTYNDSHDTIFNDYKSAPVKIRLVKKWVNDKEEDRRPVYFTIIRIDGNKREDYKTVELNEGNGWTYEEEFDGNFEWDVREETELSGYTKGEAVKTVLEDGTIVFEIPNTIDHPLTVYLVAIPGVIAAGYVVSRRFLMGR